MGIARAILNEETPREFFKRTVTPQHAIDFFWQTVPVSVCPVLFSFGFSLRETNVMKANIDKVAAALASSRSDHTAEVLRALSLLTDALRVFLPPLLLRDGFYAASIALQQSSVVANMTQVALANGVISRLRDTLQGDALRFAFNETTYSVTSAIDHMLAGNYDRCAQWCAYAAQEVGMEREAIAALMRAAKIT